MTTDLADRVLAERVLWWLLGDDDVLTVRRALATVGAPASMLGTLERRLDDVGAVIAAAIVAEERGWSTVFGLVIAGLDPLTPLDADERIECTCGRRVRALYAADHIGRGICRSTGRSAR